jgi:hypothetical protein
VSRRGITDIFKNFFNLDLALCSTCNVASRVGMPVNRLPGRSRLTPPRRSFSIFMRPAGKTKKNAATLWTFVSDLCVYFLISASRGAKILEEVLGPVFNGVIGSDDHSAYSAYLKNGKRQLCWPHLIKKTQGAQKQPSQPGSLYLCLKHAEGNGRLFTYWHAYLESDCSLEQLYHATTLIRARMKKYCYKYSE